MLFCAGIAMLGELYVLLLGTLRLMLLDMVYSKIDLERKGDILWSDSLSSHARLLTPTPAPHNLTPRTTTCVGLHRLHRLAVTAPIPHTTSTNLQNYDKVASLHSL